MSLTKSSVVEIERVIHSDELEVLGPESLEEPEHNTRIPGIYSEMQAIYTTACNYSDSVDIFLGLSETLETIASPGIRVAMHDGIGQVLNDMGAGAATIFKSDDILLKASSGIISEKIMLPTLKLRAAMSRMRLAHNSQTNVLDRVIDMVDRLMDVINVRTLEMDEETLYYTVSRDDIN